MAKAKRGRPRSQKSREAILTAARDLLQAEDSSGLTIEALAKQAGGGKPTLYRWWPSLADIVLEALLQQADEAIHLAPFTTLQESLKQFLRHSMEALNAGNGAHLQFLMAQAQHDADFRERFRTNFVSQRRATLRSIFQQAQDHTAMDSKPNMELILDIIFGAMWYRLLIGHAPLDTTFADDLTDVVTKIV